MGDVYFYQLSRSAPEQTLARLIERALDAEWRVYVRGRSDDYMRWLDEKLWLVAGDGGFLPHGHEAAPHAGAQPVLLGTAAPGEAAANDPTCLMLLEGAGIAPEEARRMIRCCVLFNGDDEEALKVARAQWRRLTAEGIGAQYWSEGSGRWEKKAEAPARPADADEGGEG